MRNPRYLFLVLENYCSWVIFLIRLNWRAHPMLAASVRPSRLGLYCRRAGILSIVRGVRVKCDVWTVCI
jgi:hypothetical protein